MKKLLCKKQNEITKKKKGFTLVELIIVIAIIAILAAMAIPKFRSVRIDAKVNNDVVAAKNIQTQVQTGIANGTIGESNVTSTEVDSSIYQKLDGKAGVNGGTEAVSGDKFYYAVDASGNVTVSVGNGKAEYQLAPEVADESTDNGRSKYAIEAAK